jgi:protein SCO1/2
MQASPLDSTNIARSFSARGIIRELPVGGQSVVIRHEDIPGFMPRMTMDFTVRSSNVLRGFKPGDAIQFRVVANENESWIEDLKPDSTNGLPALPPPGPSTASLLHLAKLKRGEVLPDVELLGEDGRLIKLSEFEGKAVVFTFIFSRCPLPDYCPRMNQHFSKTREILAQKPGMATNWQFISISFDAEFDQPGVLTRYAYSYRGKDTNRWFFAAAPADSMASMVPQLDFHFVNEGGSFVHNLRTVVLDSRRRLFKQFDGNKWTAEDLADAIAQAIEAGKKP